MRVRELRVTYCARSDLQAIDGRRPLNCPREAAHLLARLLEAEAVEVFGILCLTMKHRLIAWHEVSRGCLTSTVVHPREVFKSALLANAAAIVLGHCHPSGDPSPSPDDIALTSRLASAGDLLGVSVLDHVIVGHDGEFYSFRQDGKIT